MIPGDGDVRRIPAYEGDILHNVLMKYKIPGINATCNGGDKIAPVHDMPLTWMSQGPYCDGCHVIIHEKWFDKMYVSYQERAALQNLDAPIAKT